MIWLPENAYAVPYATKQGPGKIRRIIATVAIAKSEVRAPSRSLSS